MENMYKLAKIFIQSIVILFTKVENVENISYDPNQFTLFEISMTNPRNNENIRCLSIIDNSVIYDGEIDLWTRYNFLMEVLLDYTYKIDSDSSIRDRFSEVFNQEEIKLMNEYVRMFPYFKKISEPYENT